MLEHSAKSLEQMEREARVLARKLARSVRRKMKKEPPLQIISFVSPERANGIDHGPDRAFLRDLKRGKHLNDDFLGGAWRKDR